MDRHGDRYTRLIDRARRREPVLIDGATGTEALRRGAPEPEHGWSGSSVLTHPDLVRDVHVDYLGIGADLVVSNTFATARNVLADIGRAADFEFVNRRAVELVVEARDIVGARAADAVIGAGISNWSFTGEELDLDRLHHDTRRQATIMRDAGAEMFSLEMMVDHDRFAVTLDAVSGLGLPIWVGFSVGPEEGHPAHELDAEIRLRDAGSLAAAVSIAAAHGGVDAVCVMHTDVRLVAPSIRVIAEHFTGPVGAYGHASQLTAGLVSFEDAISPADYVAHLDAWRAAGATMIGGCCGIGPDHLRQVADALLD